MKSRTTRLFRKYFKDLPPEIQEATRAAFRVFIDNPSHPGLRFKKIHPSEPIYSVRITRDYRAVGVLEKGEVTWYWIGSHSDYDRLTS